MATWVAVKLIETPDRTTYISADHFTCILSAPAGGGQLLFAGTKDNSITIQEPEDRFITSMGGASFDATRA